MPELFDKPIVPIKTLRDIHAQESQFQMGATNFSEKSIVNTRVISGVFEAGEVNESELFFQSLFGDGNDGDVESSGDITLTADAFYNNLTIKDGHTLYTAGYRLYVKEQLTIEEGGAIKREGNNGSNGSDAKLGPSGYYTNRGEGLGAPGAALSPGSLYGATAGQTGASGGHGQDPSRGGDPNAANGSNGAGGTDLAKCIASDGVAGVAGGNAFNQTGGTAGAKGSKTGTVLNFPRGIVSAYQMADFIHTDGTFLGTTLKSSAGSGAGGGGAGADAGVGNYGGGGGQAGGSASSGGIVWIAARKIRNNGTISVKGGDGGDGGDGGSDAVNLERGGGGGAPGAGGSGGVMILIYVKKIGDGTLNISGGNAGAIGTGGLGSSGNGDDAPAGNNGEDGTLIELAV